MPDQNWPPSSVYNSTSATRSRLPTYLAKTYVQTAWWGKYTGKLYIEQEAIKRPAADFGNDQQLVAVKTYSEERI